MTVVKSMHMKKNEFNVCLVIPHLCFDNKCSISSATVPIYFLLAQCGYVSIFTLFVKMLNALYESLNAVVAPISLET